MPELDRRALLLGVLGAAGAAVAACSDDSPPPTATSTPAAVPTSSPSPSPSPVEVVPRWPLTGRRLKDPDDARHAAVAVKVPDNRNEHPQSGLDRADIVFVELDGYRDASGYSSTRLVPVFHSRMPDDVGPVRSMRPVDVPLLSPIHALIGSTGASAWVRNYVKHFRKGVDGSLTYIDTKGSGSYSIDPDRVRTYQGVTYYDRAVVCHPGVLARQTSRFRSGPPRAYFPWAESDDEVSTASGRDAAVVRVPWKSGSSYDMTYRFDEGTGRYRRYMPWGRHVLSDGTKVSTDNVLVVRARQRYDKIYRGGGHDEPIHEIIDARGTFFYVHGGSYVTGTWEKGAVDRLFRFTTDDGEPLRMAPGQTYVELPKSDAKVRITA